MLPAKPARQGRRAGGIADGFVDDVPAGDLPLKMSDECMNVIPESREHQIAIGILKEPRIRLRMPNQTVSHCLDVVVLAEIDQRFRLGPVPGVFLRVHWTGFHRVLGSDYVELRFDQIQFHWIEFVRCAEIQRRANQKDVLACVLQGRNKSCCRLRARPSAGSGRRYDREKIPS